MATPTSIGASLRLDGEREFKKALSEINQGLKVTASELMLVTAKYSDNANSVKALTERGQILERQIYSQQEKIAKLREALTHSVNTYGEADTRTMKWRVSLNQAEAELVKMEKELDKNSEALDEARKNMEKYGLSADEVADKSRGIGGIISDLADKLGINLPTGADKAIKALDGTKVSTLALVGAVAGLVKGFADAAIQTAKTADEILTLSSTTGLATDTIQKMNYASELLDVSTETITGSMSRMIRSLNQAQKGTGDAADAFRKLHVNIRDSRGQLKDSETLFYQVIDALGKVRNETERDALAMQIFGRSARELNPLIEAGSGALKELGDEAERMGYVMSEDTLSSFGALDDAMQRFNKQTETFKQSIGMVLLPVLTDFFEMLNKIDPQVLAVGATLAATIVTVLTAIKAVKNITDTFKAFDAQTWKTTAIVLGVTAALIALVAIIGVLVGKGKEMEQTMAGIGDSVGKMTNIVNNAPNQLQQRIGRNALGTSNWRGGLTWVGEEGPELLDVPAGSRIIDNRRSMQLVRQSANGGDVYIGNVTMNVNADDFRKVEDFINLFEQFRQVKRAGMVMK